MLCESLSVLRELTPRSHDLVCGAGERLSAGLVAHVLQQSEIPAVSVDLSYVFPQPLDTSLRNYHQQAKQHLSKALQTARESSGYERPVCVVSGYMGEIKGGIIQGVGRGYSDLTAALVAAASNASALQIWKESDGIFTGNPTKIKNARLLSYVTPREAAELTYFGNEVLHPFTMECAIEENIPIQILNTFNPASGGTTIDPTGYTGDRKSDSGLVAVASKKDISVLNLTSNRQVTSPTYIATVFAVLAKYNAKADLISSAEANLSITIHESVSHDTIEKIAIELGSIGHCQVQSHRAIVSAIGEGMKHQVGLAARMFSCLAREGINFEMISQVRVRLGTYLVVLNCPTNASPFFFRAPRRLTCRL